MNLIFDLDGTLVHSLPGIAQSLNESLKQHQLTTHDDETIRDFIGNGSRNLCDRAANFPKKKLLDSLEQAFMANYQRFWKTGTDIYPGIMDLLENLTDEHQLHVLSNKPHAFTTEIITTLFPTIPFHTVLGQRQGISKKPDPSGIHEILENAPHPTSPAYLIGDSVVDLNTAKNANIQSIAVSWGFEPESDLAALEPDHIVHSAHELQALIPSLASHTYISITMNPSSSC